MNRELIHLHILWLLMLSPLAQNALATSNIDPDHKYAWSATSGWLNFHPIYDGVMVYPDHLEGEAWAEQSGWVQLGSYSGGGSHHYENTSSTNCGVNHDGAGQLSGYAWSDTLGWLNFNPIDNPVIIDKDSDDFQGNAWSELGGWIRFQQDDTPSYKVRYSLKEKPTLLPTLTVSVSGSGSISSVPNGIVCSEADGDCQFQYEEGATVTLIPTAVADYQFSHWEGDSDCNDSQLVMTTDISCIAHFQPVGLPPPPDPCVITTLSGSFLGSQIRADSTSLIQDVRLKADFIKLTGGQLDGIVQGDPTGIAQIDAAQILPTAQLSYVCLSPTVQLPSNLDNVIGEGVTSQENQCKVLGALSPEEISELIPEQFRRFPPSSLNGLSSDQLSEFSAAILNEFSSPHLAAINPEEFKKLPNRVIGRILVNLNVNNITPAEVEPLLPTGWDIKQSGALPAPVGTQLTLRNLPPPVDLPDNVKLPTQPDFQTSFALGGKSNISTIADFNQVSEVTISQNDQGVLETIDSNQNHYAFRSDNDNMLQIKEMVTGLARDEVHLGIGNLFAYLMELSGKV